MAMLEEKTTPRGQNQLRGQNQSHRLNMMDRESMTVTGVKDVMSFDETEIQTRGKDIAKILFKLVWEAKEKLISKEES